MIHKLCEKGVMHSKVSLPQGIIAAITSKGVKKGVLTFEKNDRNAPLRSEGKSKENEHITLPIPEKGQKRSLMFGDIAVNVERLCSDSDIPCGEEKGLPNVYNASTYLLLKFIFSIPAFFINICNNFNIFFF